MAQPSSGTLHGALLSALQDARTPQGPRTFSLTTLRSQPYRSYTLFPQATDQSKRVYKEDIQVLLAEQLPATEASLDAPTSVPVFGLEASLYTIRETSTCLIYISKVDTTGLHPSQSPARLLTTAFLSFHLSHPPRSASRLRIHTFARAAREGQYLFPGSVDNVDGGTGEGAKGKGRKRLLDDKQLIRWWKGVLTDALRSTASPSSSTLRPSQASPVSESLLRAFYLLPGFDYAESLPLVPPSGPVFPYWVYGHPYTSLPSPLSSPLTPTPPPDSSSTPLSDLIPAFSDDPKARFLSSLASSNLSSSGEVNDWDDYTSSTLEALTSASVLAKRKEEMEGTRKREKGRIDKVGVEEFWERMGARQECSDGRVSAFFVIAREPEAAEQSSEGAEGTTHHLSMHAEPGSVPRNVWTNLWSKFHNVDYSSVSKAAAAYSTWSSDVRSCVLSATSSPSAPGSPTRAPAGPIHGLMASTSGTGIAPQPSGETVFEYAVQTVVTVDNPVAATDPPTVVGAKRSAEDSTPATFTSAAAAPAQGVTMLQPKKKKPKPAPVANGS